MPEMYAQWPLFPDAFRIRPSSKSVVIKSDDGPYRNCSHLFFFISPIHILIAFELSCVALNTFPLISLPFSNLPPLPDIHTLPLDLIQPPQKLRPLTGP